MISEFLASKTISSRHKDLLLLFVDSLVELIFVFLGRNNFSVFCNGFLQFFVHFHLSESDFLASSAWDREDLSIIFAWKSSPHGSCLVEEVFFLFEIPVLVFVVELQVILLRHIVHSQNTIFSLHGQVLVSGNWSWYHLFKVMDFIDIFVLVPESVWSVYKN